MSALSKSAVNRLLLALTSKDLGNEVADAINKGEAVAAQTAYVIAAVIVATNVSQTVDFGKLKKDDFVLHLGAAAGNADFQKIATAGDLGEAAVVGDLYVVLRAISLPAASKADF